mmetsp:Transcript_1580/g.3014  ORF Transcript_1580/g.3014 Transcript_1580/m.3014 type:complete len:265 (-) Transcript_1580:151-945(-)
MARADGIMREDLCQRALGRDYVGGVCEGRHAAAQRVVRQHGAHPWPEERADPEGVQGAHVLRQPGHLLQRLRAGDIVQQRRYRACVGREDHRVSEGVPAREGDFCTQGATCTEECRACHGRHPLADPTHHGHDRRVSSAVRLEVRSGRHRVLAKIQVHLCPGRRPSSVLFQCSGWEHRRRYAPPRQGGARRRASSTQEHSSIVQHRPHDEDMEIQCQDQESGPKDGSGQSEEICEKEIARVQKTRSDWCGQNPSLLEVGNMNSD